MFDRRLAYACLALYAILGVFAIHQLPTWTIDVIVAWAAILVVLAARKPLELDTADFIMANTIILIHNAGFFGLYEHTFIFSYDIYAHLINSALLAIIICKVLQRTTALRTVSLLLITISITTSLTLSVEFVEFAGQYLVAEQGPSIGLAGTGHPENAYTDTMKDIFMNILGATIGAVIGRGWKRKGN